MPIHPWQDVLALVELAAPTACAGCGEAGTRWCAACSDLLVDARAHAWSPTPCPPRMPATWSALPYADAVRHAVVAWKDGGRTDLTPHLGRVVRSVLAAVLAGSPPHLAALVGGRPVALVPAPSARAGTRARGEHRVGALTRAAAHGIPARRLVVLDALRLTRRVADQSGLGAGGRMANLSGAVSVRRAARSRVVGVPCVLVDDVVTTGATLVECARALREAGSGPVVAATVAATRRWT
ncbi:ComF family protein [Ornithinimicrobium sp. Y1694]|uniref:ComF family protein n=1 Tax=Ornithinimicrobium sp. Y1694 TaxID=3418590 RepID=UPI003CF11A9A